MPKIEKWFFSNGSLCGFIYNDNRFPDGTPVTTSKVIKYDEENNTVQTRNTLYELGEKG
jgi:hypothetical protein